MTLVLYGIPGGVEPAITGLGSGVSLLLFDDKRRFDVIFNIELRPPREV